MTKQGGCFESPNFIMELVAGAGSSRWYKTSSCWYRKVVAVAERWSLVPEGNRWCRKVVAGAGRWSLLLSQRLLGWTF